MSAQNLASPEIKMAARDYDQLKRSVVDAQKILNKGITIRSADAMAKSVKNLGRGSERHLGSIVNLTADARKEMQDFQEELQGASKVADQYRVSANTLAQTMDSRTRVSVKGARRDLEDLHKEMDEGLKDTLPKFDDQLEDITGNLNDFREGADGTKKSLHELVEKAKGAAGKLAAIGALGGATYMAKEAGELRHKAAMKFNLTKEQQDVYFEVQRRGTALGLTIAEIDQSFEKLRSSHYDIYRQGQEAQMVFLQHMTNARRAMGMSVEASAGLVTALEHIEVGSDNLNLTLAGLDKALAIGKLDAEGLGEMMESAAAGIREHIQTSPFYRRADEATKERASAEMAVGAAAAGGIYARMFGDQQAGIRMIETMNQRLADDAQKQQALIASISQGLQAIEGGDLTQLSEGITQMMRKGDVAGLARSMMIASKAELDPEMGDVFLKFFSQVTGEPMETMVSLRKAMRRGGEESKKLLSDFEEIFTVLPDGSTQMKKSILKDYEEQIKEGQHSYEDVSRRLKGNLSSMALTLGDPIERGGLVLLEKVADISEGIQEQANKLGPSGRIITTLTAVAATAIYSLSESLPFLGGRLKGAAGGFGGGGSDGMGGQKLGCVTFCKEEKRGFFGKLAHPMETLSKKLAGTEYLKVTIMKWQADEEVGVYLVPRKSFLEKLFADPMNALKDKLWEGFGRIFGVGGREACINICGMQTGKQLGESFENAVTNNLRRRGKIGGLLGFIFGTATDINDKALPVYVTNAHEMGGLGGGLGGGLSAGASASFLKTGLGTLLAGGVASIAGVVIAVLATAAVGVAIGTMLRKIPGVDKFFRETLGLDRVGDWWGGVGEATETERDAEARSLAYINKQLGAKHTSLAAAQKALARKRTFEKDPSSAPKARYTPGPGEKYGVMGGGFTTLPSGERIPGRHPSLGGAAGAAPAPAVPGVGGRKYLPIVYKEGVNVANITPETRAGLEALNRSVQDRWGVALRVTSGTGGRHRKGSKHYSGEAVDVTLPKGFKMAGTGVGGGGAVSREFQELAKKEGWGFAKDEWKDPTSITSAGHLHLERFQRPVDMTQRTSPVSLAQTGAAGGPVVDVHQNEVVKAIDRGTASRERIALDQKIRSEANKTAGLINNNQQGGVV
jgi:hypothetical protein